MVALHCPLSPATRGLIGRAELALMRPGALLLNCARGSVVDREALWEALQVSGGGGTENGMGGWGL